MEIKKPSSADVKKLYELELKAFEIESYPTFFFRQAIELFPNTFYIAEKNDNVVGYCLGSIVIGHNDKGWILSLAVDENFQRKGIGTELLLKVIGELKNLRCKDVFLTVFPQNIGAKKTFERCGFRKVSTDDNYFGEGNPREIMGYKIKGGK